MTTSESRETHKPIGLIVFRDVHTNPSYPFRGLSLWVAAELNGCLGHMELLLKSPVHFVARVRHLRLGVDDCMLRIDITRFYMSGSAPELSKNTTE